MALLRRKRLVRFDTQVQTFVKRPEREILTLMYGPAVRRKRLWSWRGWSCANVSGPCGAKLLAIMDIRAHLFS